MKKAFLILIAVTLVAAIVGVYIISRGPDVSHYEVLRTPRLTTLPDQQMLEITLKGSPETIAATGIELLYKAYFSLETSRTMVAPRARWPLSADVPQNEWIGIFGLPLPASIDQVPHITSPDSVSVGQNIWHYGQVAEILHVGPYDREHETVQRLLEFVSREGYSIIGPHEEEYVRGPGIVGKGNPQKYYTVIRYRVAPMTAVPEISDTTN